MKINKTVAGMISATALMAVAATAASAQAPGFFNYTTTFLPNPVTTTDPMSNIIVTNGADTGDNAAFSSFGTQINLTNFRENSTSPTVIGSFSDPVSIAVSITPQSAPGATITNTFTGIFSGSFNATGTATGLTFTASGPGSAPQSYNFGSAGIYTINAPLFFTPPGATGSSTLGAIAANVSFTPAASPVPEMGTVVPFLFGGLGLLALAVRKTRKAASVTA